MSQEPATSRKPTSPRHRRRRRAEPPPSCRPAAAPSRQGSRASARSSCCVLIVCSLAWYFVADRLTPYTSQARVQAFVVPVAAEVSGKVLKVHVKNNDEVQPGQPLFDIDPDALPDRAAAQPLGLRVGAALGQCARTRRWRRRRPAVQAAKASYVYAQQDATRLEQIYTEDPGAHLAAPRPERAGHPHQGAQPGEGGRGRSARARESAGERRRQERAADQRPLGGREGRARPQAHQGGRARRRHGDRPADRRRPVRAGRRAGDDADRHPRPLDQRRHDREQPRQHQARRRGRRSCST